MNLVRNQSTVHVKKEKKAYNPREGWEDGTRRHHTGILRRGVTECGASRSCQNEKSFFFLLCTTKTLASQRSREINSPQESHAAGLAVQAAERELAVLSLAQRELAV